MRYYINGQQVTATKARQCAEDAYIGQGGDYLPSVRFGQ